MTQFLVFSIKEKRFAIDVKKVSSVFSASEQKVSLVNSRNRFLIGNTLYRGLSIKLYRLYRYLMVAEPNLTVESRFISIRAKGEHHGFLVEQVLGVFELETKNIKFPSTNYGLKNIL